MQTREELLSSKHAFMLMISLHKKLLRKTRAQEDMEQSTDVSCEGNSGPSLYPIQF